MATRMTPKRGEIWRVRFDPAVGAEIRKLRPAVVVSLDYVGRLPLRIVVPLTSWKSAYRGAAWMVRVPASRGTGLTKDSGADAFQVRSVSEIRFDRKIGVATLAQLQKISAAIATCVGVP